MNVEKNEKRRDISKLILTNHGLHLSRITNSVVKFRI